MIDTKKEKSGELIPADKISSKGNLTTFGKELLANAATSGVINQLIDLSIKGGGALGLFLSLGIPSLGVASTLFDSFQSKKNIKVIELELEKLKRAVELIDVKMEKHGLHELINLSGASLNPTMYEFLRNAFTEAVNAKTEKIRGFCASFITYVGGFDFNGDEIDYTRLYRYLDYIKQLDELDFYLLNLYILSIQNYQNDDFAEELEKNKRILLENKSVNSHEIRLSINKLARLGLFDKETDLYPYDNEKNKKEMIQQIERVNSLDAPSFILVDFGKHVFTFI
ncbi:hypothetical protein [Gottfriedia acidiceleris]|uniref:hypothetical protein n=1 Tax=Gottfriedia acidiceleris TaxID=371036 RepID=UPI0030008473